MKKRLHIHFGIHRTGTTSIHKNLLNNIDTLKDMGICYPELGVKHRHVKLAWQLISKKTNIETVIDNILNEANAQDAQMVILSSEDFSLIKDIKWLKTLSKYFDLSGSIYLRRQDLWLESWYNQHIKWPWDKNLSSATPEKFLKNIDKFFWIDYMDLLVKICKVIPKDKLYVNTMEKSGVQNTTLDFFEHCGIDMARIKFVKPENESISSMKLSILRRIDLMTLPKNTARRKILKVLKELDISGDNGSKEVFTDMQVLDILQKYNSSNSEVAREFLGRDKLFLDEVKLNREPKFVSDRQVYEELIPEILRRVALL